MRNFTSTFNDKILHGTFMNKKHKTFSRYSKLFCFTFYKLKTLTLSFYIMNMKNVILYVISLYITVY